MSCEHREVQGFKLETGTWGPRDVQKGACLGCGDQVSRCYLGDEEQAELYGARLTTGWSPWTTSPASDAEVERDL